MLFFLPASPSVTGSSESSAVSHGFHVSMRYLAILLEELLGAEMSRWSSHHWDVVFLNRDSRKAAPYLTEDHE